MIKHIEGEGCMGFCKRQRRKKRIANTKGLQFRKVELNPEIGPQSAFGEMNKDAGQDEQQRFHEGELTPKTWLQSAFGDKEEVADKEHISNDKLLDFPNGLVNCHWHPFHVDDHELHQK